MLIESGVPGVLQLAQKHDRHSLKLTCYPWSW